MAPEDFGFVSQRGILEQLYCQDDKECGRIGRDIIQGADYEKS